MKKLLAVVLILALALPALALADQDDIVGTWYFYSGLADDPVLYFEIDTIHFSPEGNIFSSRYTVSSSGVTTCKDYNIIGFWTKEDGHYYINLGLNGAEEIDIENNTVFFPVSESYKLRFTKMKPVNYVIDLKQ